MTMDKASLVPISADLLYAGMVVPHDILNSTNDILLMAQGNILNTSQIERIKRLNGGFSTIHVSAETERVIRNQGVPNSMIKSSHVLEEKTGYTEIKYEIVDMIDKISSKKTSSISKHALSTVSNELSHTVDSTAPAIILDLVNALACADEYLQRHCVNVSLLNGLFGKWLELPKETVDILVLVGLLHDCGKVSIPSKILGAPRALTGVEFEVIKTHPLFSYDLLTEFPEEIRRTVRGHHEKINGCGYPDGHAGSDIPYISRITAISDIYDAMVSKRAYKEPKNPFSILAMIKELSGTELDPQLVDVFIRKIPQELIGKPVMLSDGTIGVVDSIDRSDVEFPVIKSGDRVIKTSDALSCVSMYFE